MFRHRAVKVALFGVAVALLVGQADAQPPPAAKTIKLTVINNDASGQVRLGGTWTTDNAKVSLKSVTVYAYYASGGPVRTGSVGAGGITGVGQTSGQ
ncbi:MAG: hypothetical protein K2X87_20180 [Gemmataceae bacterium]|nr:hypothetical protein [Gemmataceae bacterium]